MDKELEKPFIFYTENDIRVIELLDYIKRDKRISVKIKSGKGGIPKKHDLEILKILLEGIDLISIQRDNRILKVNFLLDDLVVGIYKNKGSYKDNVKEIRLGIERLAKTKIYNKISEVVNNSKTIYYEDVFNMIEGYRIYNEEEYYFKNNILLHDDLIKDYQYLLISTNSINMINEICDCLKKSFVQ